MLFKYMTNVTSLTGVDSSHAKESMKDVLRFEATLAMVKSLHLHCYITITTF